MYNARPTPNLRKSECTYTDVSTTTDTRHAHGIATHRHIPQPGHDFRRPATDSSSTCVQCVAGFPSHPGVQAQMKWEWIRRSADKFPRSQPHHFDGRVEGSRSFVRPE